MDREDCLGAGTADLVEPRHNRCGDLVGVSVGEGTDGWPGHGRRSYGPNLKKGRCIEMDGPDDLGMRAAEYVYIELPEHERRRLRIGTRQTFVDRVDALF